MFLDSDPVQAQGERTITYYEYLFVPGCIMIGNYIGCREIIDCSVYGRLSDCRIVSEYVDRLHSKHFEFVQLSIQEFNRSIQPQSPSFEHYVYRYDENANNPDNKRTLTFYRYNISTGTNNDSLEQSSHQKIIPVENEYCIVDPITGNKSTPKMIKRSSYCFPVNPLIYEQLSDWLLEYGQPMDFTTP